MKLAKPNRVFIFFSTLLIISLACSTLTGDPGTGYYDDVPPPPSPPPGYTEEDYSDSGQSLFQPVMRDVLIETARSMGYPTPYEPDTLYGISALTYQCMSPEGCVFSALGEFLYQDGTVGPSFYKYSYPLPISEVGVACDQELNIQVNHLTDTYRGTLEYRNYWNEHPAYSLETSKYTVSVYPLFYESDWEIGIGYSWEYNDIMVDFYVTGTKMRDNCWGPGEVNPYPDVFDYFYDTLLRNGLVN